MSVGILTCGTTRGSSALDINNSYSYLNPLQGMDFIRRVVNNLSKALSRMERLHCC